MASGTCLLCDALCIAMPSPSSLVFLGLFLSPPMKCRPTLLVEEETLRIKKQLVVLSSTASKVDPDGNLSLAAADLPVGGEWRVCYCAAARQAQPSAKSSARDMSSPTPKLSKDFGSCDALDAA